VPRIASSGPRIDVRDLQVVLALASAGTTAGASKLLHLTQSAVSRALRLAEDKLGTPIFDRTARGLMPTAAGQRLIAGAGAVLAQLTELEEAAIAPVAPSRIRVVCECYTAYRWLPSALAKLRERLPNLEVTLAIEHTGDPIAALLAGEIDVALLTTAPVRGGLREEPLFSDEIVFVVAASHALAARPSITSRDLREHRLVTSNTPPAEAEWFLKQVFGRKRPKLDFLRFPLTEAIVDAARAGMGIAVLSEWIASVYLHQSDLVAKRFAPEELRRPWRIAFRDEAALVARSLASALQGSAPRVYASAPSILRSARR
jgi:LysR family transcriptional regulator, regulator for metE and metH